MVSPFRDIPLGYEQLTGLSAAKALASIPAGGAPHLYLEAQTQDIRFRDDGVAPTSTVGMLLKAGVPQDYYGPAAALQFIEVTASAVLNVFYRRTVG